MKTSRNQYEREVDAGAPLAASESMSTRNKQEECVFARPSHRHLPLESAVQIWLQDGRAAGHSPRTTQERAALMAKVGWWLANERQLPAELGSLCPEVIRGFLNYCGSANPDGRWGVERLSSRKAPTQTTVRDYYGILRSFVRFGEAEAWFETSPLRNVKPPKAPANPPRPLTKDEVEGLLAGAWKGAAPARDKAIILTLLDSGLRVSELCALTVRDIQENGEITVRGKGAKLRTVVVSRSTRRAVWDYRVRFRPNADPRDPLFTSIRGRNPGGALTVSGISDAVRNAARAGALHRRHVSPHLLRHTFAIMFLRSGANILELQKLLGHADLAMVRRYSNYAEADVLEAHRKHSPVEGLGLR